MANNKIQVKRTNVSGRTANVTSAGNAQYIDAGELALNMADGILYTSNGSALITIGANNVNVRVTGNLTVNSIVANGSQGTAGQVLTSNGTTTYWSTVSSGSGTVTSVGSGNGLTGGPITTSGSLSVLANNGITVNSTGVYVNDSYIATLSANNASFLGGVAAASYVNTTGNFTVSGNINFTGTNNYFSALTQFNAGIWRSTGNGPAYWLQQDGTGRSHWYWGTAGGSSPTFAVSGEDASALTLHISNAGAGGQFFHRSASGVGKVAGDPITWTTTFFTDLNTISWKGSAIAVANGSTYNLVANNATNLGGVAASGYQTTAGLSANVATLTANNTSFVGTVSAANVVSNAQLSSNLANYQTTAGLAANVATLTANNSSFLGGVAAASYVQNTDSRTLSGNLNFTGANVNFTAGLFSGANVVANNTALRVGNTTITTTNTVLGGTLAANGGIGSAGQVLTSGAAGNVYWASASGGGYYKGGASAVGTLAGGGQNIFRVNANTLNNNTTFVAGENGQATGPLAIAAGVTLTIETGARVSIV